MVRKGPPYPGLWDWVVLIMVLGVSVALLMSPLGFRVEAARALRATCFYPLRLVMYFSSSLNDHPVDEIPVSEIRLRSQIDRAKCEEALMENERLRKLLDFSQTENRQLLLTQVIGRSPDRFGEVIDIARGENDGVVIGQSVLGTEGLVGVVTATDSRESWVKTLRNDGFGASGLLQQTRHIGALRWNPAVHLLNLEGIPIEASVDSGEVVITSGFGRIFPKGLPVGEVVEVRNDSTNLVKEILVRPYVDFNRIEEVFLLNENATAEREG